MVRIVVFKDCNLVRVLFLTQLKFIMKTYAAIITDVPNGYTYKTAVVTTVKRAKKLAQDFVIRKNIDYADIEVVTLDIL